MATTTGLSVAQLQTKIDQLKAQGKTESTSKELGKYVDALKVLTPEKYGAETVASAKLKLKSSTTPQTQQQLGIGSSNTALSSTSIPGMSSGQPSSIDLNKIYENELNSPELKTLQDELNAKKTARDTAEADINDNPYYTEATRVGKVSKLNQRANNEITTLQSQIDQRKADAQVKVNIATQQYNIEDKQYQNNIEKLNLLISSGAINGASSSDLAQIALATGMSTTQVSALKQAASQKAIEPYVVNSTDDYGNVTVSIIDLNTGNVVATNKLGAVGKGSSGTSGFNLKDFWGNVNSGGSSNISSLWGE